MPDRKCLTCKHYEPSPIRHKGWCRNPLLFSPQQSHLVDQDALDCGRRYGNFWESAVPVAAGPDDETEADQQGAERKRLRFFEPRARLVPATASVGLIARSSGGDDGGGPVLPPSRGGGTSGSEPPPAGQPRMKRTGLPQGQERTVSYQPEERYWTDYLRIALPVVGLLLMLGLFWYWASSVIGDDDDDPPATATGAVALVTVTAPPPTATSEVEIGADQVTPTAGGEAATDGDQTPPADGGEEPAETEETEVLGKGFQPGDVVITQGEVNLRGEPSADGELIATLEDGTELEVTEPAVEGGDYFWIGVRNTATEEEGYVADEFVDAGE